ncbi:MAG TPA: tetratricopeptide repeat protein, partial [Methylomirabilota bacterium]|nr:tetratricopeptide repeat protein [Methylomirabilota bacterium]
MSRVALLLVLVLAGCATAAAPTPPAAPVAGAGPPAPPSPAAPGPEAAPAHLERGQALIARGEMAAAATALREALRLEPDLLPARVSLGRALYGLGDLDAAAEELRAALRRQPDALDARLTLARVLIARQEWTAAREELDRILTAEPEQADARYALGVVRYAQRDVAGAIEAYRGVLARDPQQADARYNLALVLHLARREAEATPEFVAAAQAGHARAQYFAGAAYAAGLGVARSLPAAVGWWFRAAGQGVPEAEAALAQLRQVALGRSRRPGADRQAAEQAFSDYRAALWNDFPGLAADGDDTVGGALLRRGRVREAVPVLIREASALSQPALRRLEALYEAGVDGQWP